MCADPGPRDAGALERGIDSGWGQDVMDGLGADGNMQWTAGAQTKLADDEAIHSECRRIRTRAPRPCRASVHAWLKALAG